MIELAAEFSKPRHMFKISLGAAVGYFPIDDTEDFLEKLSMLIELAREDEHEQISMADHISQAVAAWDRMMDMPAVEKEGTK